MNDEDIILPVEYVEKLQQENKQLHNKIDKVIEIAKLCNSQCAKEIIKILEEVKD